MYIVFNSWIQIEKNSREDAIKTARLNSAAVYDFEKDCIICDCRTAETESDERG